MDGKYIGVPVSGPARRRKRAARNALGAGVAGTALLGMIVLAIVISPLIVMVGTDYLHEFVPAIPELGFVPSLVAVLVTRALVGGGRSSASS
jgi:hypothetical protein